MQEHRREVLREASVALQGRLVTLWEVSSRAEVTPVMTSAGTAQGGDTRLDLDTTLHRWGAPIIQGSRWVVSWTSRPWPPGLAWQSQMPWPNCPASPA